MVTTGIEIKVRRSIHTALGHLCIEVQHFYMYRKVVDSNPTTVLKVSKVEPSLSQLGRLYTYVLVEGSTVSTVLPNIKIDN